MALLTKKDILSAKDIEKETVKVPEWGGEVIVSAMTGSERDKFEMLIVNAEVKDGELVRESKFEHYRAKLCSLCMQDEKGKLLFSQDDVEALGGKSAAAIQRVFNVASRLNRITQDDVEEVTKN